jgi:SepF-like predicted cell division protein (DUF552 family)
VRFPFRRREKPHESVAETVRNPPYSSLGIFSPSSDAGQHDPARECKRLADLESIFIRSKRLQSLEDVPFIVSQVRNGNIMLLDISRLNVDKEQAQLELKRIIERIRGETRSINADIALINDGCVIVAPSFVKF